MAYTLPTSERKAITHAIIGFEKQRAELLEQRLIDINERTHKTVNDFDFTRGMMDDAQMYERAEHIIYMAKMTEDEMNAEYSDDEFIDAIRYNMVDLRSYMVGQKSTSPQYRANVWAFNTLRDALVDNGGFAFNPSITEKREEIIASVERTQKEAQVA